MTELSDNIYPEWMFWLRPFLIAGVAAGLMLFSSVSAWSKVGGDGGEGGVGVRPGAGLSLKEGAGGLRVSFDLSHEEIFSPLKEGPVDYSTFYDRLKKGGSLVTINTSPVESLALTGLDVYIVAGPMREFDDEEVKALTGFVEEGGSLLVLLHISSPVARLTEAFGVIVSNYVVSEAENTLGESQNFLLKRFSKHPVTEGLKKVAVYGSWGLLAEGPASVVARTSDKAWADMDRDRLFDEGEPRSSFGIIAASKFGAGKVVVVSDDAVFANRFITEADNGRLLENIMKWFKDRGR